MLDEHFHCKDPSAAETPAVPAGSDLDEEVPMDFSTSTSTETSTESVEDNDPLEDDKVKELLAGLDDV
jgi:hypothetical protein